MITPIKNIMTRDPISIGPDADLSTALRLMKDRNVRRLPVIEDGKVIGLISTADMATIMKEEIDCFIGLEEAFVRHN